MQQPTGREHVLRYPKGFIVLRIIQLIIGVVSLGLSAFMVHYLVFSGDILMLLSSLVTLITTIYCIVGMKPVPQIFNYWAILAFDIFLVIFWLISFALLAYYVGPIFQEVNYYIDYYSYYYDYYDAATVTVAAVLAAGAAMSGIEFLLYIISLVMHSIFLHRHRKAGFHSKPGFTTTPAPVQGAAAPGAPVGGEMAQTQPQQAPPGFAPQPGYQGVPQPQPVYQAPQFQEQAPYGAPPQQQHPYPQQHAGHFPQQHTGPYPQQQQGPFTPQQQSPPQQHSPQPQSTSPVVSQTTGNSYVQGPPVAFTTGSPVYEAHGNSAPPPQPQQLPAP
jgi:hypothetical protein